MTTPTTMSEASKTRWYALDTETAIVRRSTDRERGLSASEATSRLAQFGPNELHAEAPPSVWKIALAQVLDPMNLMLLIVAIVSFLLGEISTGILVAALVLLNVVMGSRQELSAQAAVDALAKMQIPQARVVRDGNLELLPATDLVPGDIVNLEAGDIVPADGRILRSATLEAQEAALTGESQPIAKDAVALPDEDIGLGDRLCMLYQNTSVTRGSGTIVVTATGMATEMGQIASMLETVKRKRSPLQRELDSLTKILGFIAWGSVAVIIAIGMARGLETSDLLLLGTAMAISAIPTGLPTFVQAMLAYGSKQLAEAKAVVKNLTDVETLGSTSAINTDKTGTLTMNEMMVHLVYTNRQWLTVEGVGYDKHGSILGVAGAPTPDLTPLAYGLALDSDATVSDDGAVIGDPTEAALVVLAAKLGVDAVETRRTYPREAEVPFDSTYKFMATFHHLPIRGETRAVLLVKGAPDVVLARCAEEAGPEGSATVIDEAARQRINDANNRMASEGLRVLSFAARFIDETDVAAVTSDPMAFVDNLRFVSLLGIIDPLRPSAKEAVTVAADAGIDVRMITGDHATTALAIGKDLGLGPGAISGVDFRNLSDDEVLERLPGLHVFGRVAPEDKLRLVQLMQSQGQVVAMTGDAVNDAAALKQADIGVAMGSGSEVTKQAAKMILTDDNFGTLVHAVELGRSIYQKISLYVRYQMSQLLSLVLLFLAASIFNIASGVALTPIMVLWLNFLIAGVPVIVIILEGVDPGLMNRPPRDPKKVLANGSEMVRWAVYGGTLFVMTLVPLVLGPDTPSATEATASMTMAFVVMAIGTLLSGLSIRRDPGSGLTAPILKALGILAIPAALTLIATEWGLLQRFLMTQSLTGYEWLISIGLALVVLAVIETEKAVRRRGATGARPVEAAVAPQRALVGAGEKPAN
ncbi:MAG: cation-translocating P-type ATPase [Actinomycetia bacterium]|nr:cation-translocating P-type ATPase [Actinomycetes bacterium]